MKNTGTDHYLQFLSDIPVDFNSENAKQFRGKFILHPNQAVRIYDFIDLEMKYAEGFKMLGFRDEEITMRRIFDIPVFEQREVVGELSGKALAIAQEKKLKSLKTSVVLNYAAELPAGNIVHLMVQSTAWELDQAGNFKSALTTFTKLEHFRPPKLVLWDVQGEIADEFISKIDNSVVSPNRVSKREQEILQKLEKGNTVSMIASDFNRSSRTVEHQIKLMRNRYDCNSVGQLMAFAKDMNLI